MASLEQYVKQKNMGTCPECGGRLVYKYSGIYGCEKCQIEVYDDFGKVKKYIEEHGPSPANIISDATGVPMNIINKFLRKGRVEIPEGSGFYITCEICNAPIRFGRICMECAVKNSGATKGYFMEDAGERVKGNLDKMHYLGEEKKDKKNGKRRSLF